MHAACDPGIRDRRKWRPKEEMGRNGRAREEEKCSFCLQNDLKEPEKCKKCIYCLSKSLVYGIYRDYQRDLAYALRGHNSE